MAKVLKAYLDKITDLEEARKFCEEQIKKNKK